MDWIRAQYEAGANTHLTLNDSFGTELISPAMAQRFLLPYVAQIVEMVEKEFGQKVFMHVHGDMKKPKSYAFLESLVREAGVGGLHLDEKHDAAWIRECVVKQLHVPAALIVHGATWWRRTHGSELPTSSGDAGFTFQSLGGCDP